MNLGTLWVTLGVDASGLDKMTTNLNSVSQKFRTFGYLATATLTAPIVLASKASFQLAKDYEFAMQKIVGLTGEAQDSVNAWSEEILKMGPELARTPQELADALYFISSSGIRGAEAMRVLELSAKAATAGMGETQTMAQVLTSALNAYKGTGLTAAYATDILVAAVREGKAEASGFSTAMGQIIPIAAQLGVSFDQVAGGMAAITLTGASSANAAVYLKGVFNSLLTASTQGEKALNKANSSYAELRRILGTQGLIPLMQKLRDIQTQYGDELLSDVLPNIRALTGFLSLAGKNFQYNTELMKRVTESTGSLGKAFAAVADTIKVRYDSAISQAQSSMISLGSSIAEALLPLLEKLVKALERVTKWFDSLSEEQKRNKLEWLAFIALLGPVSLGISVLGYALSGLITLLRTMAGILPVLKLGITSFSLAFTGINIIAVPAIIFLTKKIHELKGKIGEMQDALDYSDRGMELDTIIGKRMGLLKELNLEELTQLKEQITERAQLDRERLLNAKSTNVALIKQEADYITLMQKYQKAKKPEEHFDLQFQMEQYITDRKAYFEYEKTAAQGNLDFYAKQGAAVDEAIKKQKGLIKTTTEYAQVLEDIQKIGNYADVKKINIGLPDKFKKESVWANARKTDWSDSSNLYSGKWKEQQAAIEEYNNSLNSQIGIVNELAKNFEDMFKHVGGGFKGMISAMLDSLRLLAAELLGKAAIYAVLQLIAPGSSMAVTALTNLRKFVGIKGYADGSNYTSGGLSLVGEKGPELLNIPKGSQVFPNDLLGAALGGGQGEVRFVIEENQLVGILNKASKRKSLY